MRIVNLKKLMDRTLVELSNANKTAETTIQLADARTLYLYQKGFYDIILPAGWSYIAIMDAYYRVIEIPPTMELFIEYFQGLPNMGGWVILTAANSYQIDWLVDNGMIIEGPFIWFDPDAHAKMVQKIKADWETMGQVSITNYPVACDTVAKLLQEWKYEYLYFQPDLFISKPAHQEESHHE